MVTKEVRSAGRTDRIHHLVMHPIGSDSRALRPQFTCCIWIATLLLVMLIFGMLDGLATFQTDPSATVQVQPSQVKPDVAIVVFCMGCQPTV